MSTHDQALSRLAGAIAANQVDEDLAAHDCEPNDLIDEAGFCQSCEYGHHGHLCRWCIADGRTL